MEHDLRIVILGNTGVGKSTLANTLFGKTDAFVTAASVGACTKKVEWQVGKQFGTTFEITDTVGTNELGTDPPEVYGKVATCIEKSDPGPHVILFVIDCSHASADDVETFKNLKSILTPDICKYMIVVFNKIDKFQRPSLDEQRQCLAEQLKRPEIQEMGIPQLLEEVNNRYIGITIRASDTERTSQARELNAMMKKLKETNQNECFWTKLHMSTVKSNLERFILQCSTTPDHNEATEKVKKIMRDCFPEDRSLFDIGKRQAIRTKERAANKCVIL